MKEWIIEAGFRKEEILNHEINNSRLDYLSVLQFRVTFVKT